MSFSDDIARFRSRAMHKVREVKRRSALDMFTSIIISTPVDKGVLRNNWFVSIGLPTSYKDDELVGDDGGAAAIKLVELELQRTSVIQDIFFTNNLPYAARIEFDGHSWRKPEGMVRINLVRWNKIVATHAKALRNE